MLWHLPATARASSTSGTTAVVHLVHDERSRHTKILPGRLLLDPPNTNIARLRFDRVDGVPAPSDNLQLHQYTPPSRWLQWLPRANEQCYRKSVSLSSADVKYRATHRASQPAISWKFPRTKLMLASPFQRLIPTALGRDREVLLTAHT